MTFAPVLTAAEMRAAEAAAIAAGTSAETLMERAGQGAAEAIRRFAGPRPALVLCGPGNNGGDGYVIARALAAAGAPVRVAACGEPGTDAARAARAAYGGPVEALEQAAPAELLIDALFGTGFTRPLGADLYGPLNALAAAARVRVSVDLPSGVATDSGALLSLVPDFDLTITFQTLKPAHLLQPAARFMGRIACVDIGVEVAGQTSVVGRPQLSAPGPESHKYNRGYVAMIGGEMPGAAALTATAACRAGAGYVRLIAGERVHNVPAAVVQGSGDAESLLADPRVGAVVIGPGLGRWRDAKRVLGQALASGRALVLDADALALLPEKGIATLRHRAAVLTPHAGEFGRLFPGLGGSKLDQARAAAAQSGAVILFKGADTVVAEPSGRAAILPPAPHWLASGGTGDVLAGVVGARLAAGVPPFEAACEAAWLHGRAAELAGPGFIADDLARHLPDALAACL